MRLSRDKIVHLSHLIVDSLAEDDRVIFHQARNDVRNEIVKVIIAELKKDEEAEKRAENKIRSLKRDIVEGSEEWDVLFHKYYQEEIARFGKVEE
jgi:hypothetical protein